MKLFSAIPFLRILMPLVAGILIGLKLDLPAIGFIYFAVLMSLMAVFNFYRIKKTLVLFFADIFLLLYGITLVAQNNISRNDTFYGKNIIADSVLNFIAVINDLPIEKNKTIKCNLTIEQVKNGNAYKPVSGTVIAYFKKPVPAGLLKAGAIVLIRSKLVEVTPPQNPFEFDYKNYLQNKQVYHTAFIDSGAFVNLPATGHLNAVWQLGLACKQVIMGRLKNSKLSDNAYTICCALLTGYDDEIDRSVMDAFSHSGTLHVLSVSGLHTGLIYLVLSFLFDLFDKNRRFKLLKFVLITITLWLFALVTGFSAPVLRAVIMFNLFGLGKIYFRNDYRNQLNILLVSAFILLVYNPFFITDVGFLLSYFALAGLIYFQPLVSAKWQPSNRLVNYTWQSISASVAATVSTLPLTLFYFKQFPIWFFVCNLVVVPATFVILFLALLVVLKLNIAAVIINYITAALIAFINLFNSERFGFIDRIHFVLPDVIYLSLLIVCVSAALHYRTYKLVMMSCFIMLAWQITALAGSFKAKQKTLFSLYQLKNTSVMAVKNKTALSFSVKDSANYNYHIKPHVISFNYPDIGIQKFNYLVKNKQSVLILNTLNCWPKVNRNSITTLILTNNFKLTEADLRQFKQLETIVADGSNNNYSIKKAEELSRKFGVNFYNTKRKGAYLLRL